MSQDIFKRFKLFTADSHGILAQHEDVISSRTISLSSTYETLDNLSVVQDDLLRQALRCVEQKLFRAAHVMAFACLMDYLEKWCSDESFVSVNNAHPNWNIVNLDNLKESHSDFAIVLAMKKGGMISKTQQKAFHGLLSRRNECAHPSDYFPNLNQSLGYVSEIIERIRKIQLDRGLLPVVSII